MRSKAYRATAVKRVRLEKLLAGRERMDAEVGVDVGKDALQCVIRWRDAAFERPWKVKNPFEIPELTGLLVRLAEERALTVAMEPTGTYGDALRQALSDAGLAVHRVSPKAAHDYAEIFDGVPSKHDGKDPAVVAELSAFGKSWPWPYEPPAAADEEMAFCVKQMDAFQRTMTTWTNRMEALLARHWPEATALLRPSSATLLHALAEYGGPGALAAAGDVAVKQLLRWGGQFLAVEKAETLAASARSTVGVRQSAVSCAQVQEVARHALEMRAQVRECQSRLRRLARGNEVIEAQGRVVGVATACVLWVSVGDPAKYHCAKAYRKAMGLNLKERSSGRCEGHLKITKRGPALARRWLFFAALRQIKDEAVVKTWCHEKRARDGGDAGKAVTGIMRKLALGLYHIGRDRTRFEVSRLFCRRAG